MNNNNHFSQGFILGAIVGGAAIFLLGTKKGNKILKTLTEDGFDGLTNLIEEIEEAQGGELPKPKKVVEKAMEGPKPEEVEEDGNGELHIDGNGFSEVHPRRFFKRK